MSARGTRHHFDLTVWPEDRNKDVLVVPRHSCRIGVGRLILERLPRLEDRLYLLMQAGGEFFRVVKLKEGLAERVFKWELPQIEKRLIDIGEAPVAVEGVGEIHDGGQHGIEEPCLLLPLFAVARQLTGLLGNAALGRREDLLCLLRPNKQALQAAVVLSQTRDLRLLEAGPCGSKALGFIHRLLSEEYQRQSGPETNTEDSGD